MGKSILFIKRSYFGAFTLIEVLVTIVIMSIIGMISVPLYTEYKTKAKVNHMLTSLSAAQLIVANDYYENGNSFTSSNYAAGATPFTTPRLDAIQSINIVNGTINVTANSAVLHGKQIDLELIPLFQNNTIVWRCAAPKEYHSSVPQSCQNTMTPPSE